MASTSSSNPGGGSVGGQSRCFQEWISIQEDDLAEMISALNAKEDGDQNDKDAFLRQLIQKTMDHFKNYAEQRIIMARKRVSTMFVPPWCSSLENSHLWIGGCRPSGLFHLAYTISGQEMETRVFEMFERSRAGATDYDFGDDFGEDAMSATQFVELQNLQIRTIKKEDRLTSEMALLQDKIPDDPIAVLVMKKEMADFSEEEEKINGELDDALDEHEKSMELMLEQADKLRIDTLKELLDILTPVQAVNFLVAGKKLHLCIHQCGKRRDRLHSDLV